MESNDTRDPTVVESHHHYQSEKEALLRRMRRLEGQVRGVQRMIEEDRYCPDIVQQLNAVISAAREVSLRLLQHHIQGCVIDAVQQGSGEAKIREMMQLLRKAVEQR